MHDINAQNECEIEIPHSLLALKNPPKKLFYRGNKDLLKNPLVAIVGSRNPNPYARMMTEMLAHKISMHAIIISGGALGIDIIAHKGAFPRTIMVSPGSLEVIYPKENAQMIERIASEALILSEYPRGYKIKQHSFLERNRIVIALSDMVILPQGDLKSGTSSSAKIALELNKPIFTIPHRYGESSLTNELLAQNKASAIYDIDEFIAGHFGDKNFSETSKPDSQKPESSDEILEFCKNAPSFEAAFAKFGTKLLEYEFMGLLVRENNSIRPK